MNQSPDQILKITLTPLSRFFFGGEVVFGSPGAQNKRRRSYLVHSNIFPQQSSILGMLREELLRQNDLLLSKNSPQSKKTRAKELIGNTGFNINLTPDHQALSPQNSFGYIKELSPLFLEDADGEIYQPVPIDDGIGKDGEKLKWKEGEGPIRLNNLDTKKGLPLRYANKSGESVAIDECFEEQHQVGITVTNRRDWRTNRANDKEAFFRKTSYKNRNSAFAGIQEKTETRYAFTFWLKMAGGMNQAQFKALSDTTVTLGGERSTFSMKIKEAEDVSELENLFFEVHYQQNTNAPNGYTRLLLLSDTYLPVNLISTYGIFPLADPVSFRFFSSFLDTTTNFYSLEREKDKNGNLSTWKKTGRRQSKKYTLLGRGGVLLVPDDHVEAVEKSIKEQTAFRQIGYNYIQKI